MDRLLCYIYNVLGILPQQAMVAMEPKSIFVLPHDCHMVSWDKKLFCLQLLCVMLLGHRCLQEGDVRASLSHR